MVQSFKDLDLSAGPGVAVREFPLAHGTADYLLYVNRRAVGVVEAKAEGSTLTGVEIQTAKYGEGVPANVPAPVRPLPFVYQSTGVETRFTCLLDPDPRSRAVFRFHRPETLAQWIGHDTLVAPPSAAAARERPLTLRARYRTMPPVPADGLWPAQHRAIENLQRSLAADRPRALIQMATGSGKTFTAVNAAYRLVKRGGTQRVLFLVDRANLGRQTLEEFQKFRVPGDGRLFTELYNVQFLQSNRIDPVARVVIGTIQRMYSILKGEEELDPGQDEESLGGLEALIRKPVEVAYSAALPPESFDLVFVDECHRSIYTLWRQVLEYFDAHLVGLTATPSKQTLGFFNKNLVMEYGHEQAVADGVNVDFDVYRIRTRITEQGSRVEAGAYVDRRERDSRRKRWEQLDEDLAYGSGELDDAVVAPDQIRTVVRAFRDRLFTEIFPGRTEVPKTLIFAKDDSHADDIVQIVREEFGRGNDFAQKITYRTGTARVVEVVRNPDGTTEEVVTWKSSGVKPEDLLSSFRNSFNPRVVVTVDMIATGTDVKPLEIVFFMRSVKSRNLFEQMKGRGVRVIRASDLKGVTPDADAKSRFVIVDAVGVCETDLMDTKPLDKKPGVSLQQVLAAVGQGNTDAEVVSTLASRLARLDRAATPAERRGVEEASGGMSLARMAAALVAALDPDVVEARARAGAGGAEPTPLQREIAGEALRMEALEVLASQPRLREHIVMLKRDKEQVIDGVSVDTLLESGFSQDARDRQEALVRSFEAFLAEHRDDIDALQILYSQPYARRLGYAEARALAQAIQAPPRAWTPEALWDAYRALDASKVRGTPTRVLGDLVSLVRFAMHQRDELAPSREVAEERFAAWMSVQQGGGRAFTPAQRRWLEAIRDHVAANLEITPDDFQDSPFAQWGGLGAAQREFGGGLLPLLDELTQVLAA
ncbi:MAG TPA: type I restriction-modification enzyme R subunit C-terminal domain-containing protein [Longimicrobium sp.]|nr:type I restriction-modification enzyme R subunit C-terminal domain-containing protein [Longimicrobium sp.]